MYFKEHLVYDMKNRKSIRLKGYDYSSVGAYFLTICVDKHKCIFGKIENEKMILNKYGKIVQEELFKTTMIRENVILDEFIVMPNHVHCILIIVDKIVNVGATRRVAPYNEQNLKTEFRGLYYGSIQINSI